MSGMQKRRSAAKAAKATVRYNTACLPTFQASLFAQPTGWLTHNMTKCNHSCALQEALEFKSHAWPAPSAERACCVQRVSHYPGAAPGLTLQCWRRNNQCNI